MDPQKAPQAPPQSQWTPPPREPTRWAGPGYAGQPPRPAGVTLAATFLIVTGVLQALAGAACVFFSAQFTIAGGGDLESWVLTGFFAAVMVIGVLSIVAGAGAISGGQWARTIGIVVSIAAIVIWAVWVTILLSLGASLGSRFLEIVIIVFYVLVIWAFVSAGPWFAYRRSLK